MRGSLHRYCLIASLVSLSCVRALTTLSLEIANIGKVTIELAEQDAPQTSSVFLNLAKSQTGGSVHRAEPVPTQGEGPPYSLVQATVEDSLGFLNSLKKEGTMMVERGTVVFICGSKDFFISLGSHPGWEVSFTVFGKVDEASMAIVDQVVHLPIHTYAHPVHGTVMSMLNSPLKMRLVAQSGFNSPSQQLDVANDLAEVKVEFILKSLDSGSSGRVVVTVVPAWAPLGAKRFLDLVDAKFYDMCHFFRVVPGFVAQWGIPDDPNGMKPWMRQAILDEPVKHPNEAGTLAFGAAGPNSRTVQVFVNFGRNSHLDGLGFATFGHVTEGMEYVQRIYSGYRETPNQGMIVQQGGQYIRQHYPLMSYIETAQKVEVHHQKLPQSQLLSGGTERHAPETHGNARSMGSMEKHAPETHGRTYWASILGIVSFIASILFVLSKLSKKRQNVEEMSDPKVV